MEFIKDKWYKMNTGDDWYAKFDRFSDSGIWLASEYIHIGKLHSVGNFGERNTYNWKLCPISEIEQWLPPTHIDRIKEVSLLFPI